MYTAFQLTLVFFPLLISNSFHFNGTAEYILDILRFHLSIEKENRPCSRNDPLEVEFLAQQ